MNILIVTLSNIGDVVMTTPVIVALKEQFPDSHLTTVMGPKAQSLLEKSKLIDELVIYDKKSNLKNKLKMIQRLRKKKYDVVVDLRNSMIPYLVSSKKRSPVFRKFSKTMKRDCHLEVLEMMGLKTKIMKRFDFFTLEDKESLQKKVEEKNLKSKGWILISPGAAAEKKRWSLEGFQQVAKFLQNNYEYEIVLVGDKGERAIAEKMAEDLKNIKIFSGETTLREMAAMISEASLVVCNDSAMMHLAFELGCPTVGIFGPTNHNLYGHEGELFRLVREFPEEGKEEELGAYENDSFYGLKPEKVLAACKEFL